MVGNYQWFIYYICYRLHYLPHIQEVFHCYDRQRFPRLFGNLDGILFLAIYNIVLLQTSEEATNWEQLTVYSYRRICVSQVKWRRLE